MKNRSKIEKQVIKKTNPNLVETIRKGKKKSKWLEVIGIIAGPKSLYSKINLDEIKNKAEEKKTIVIPGKVLSMGEIKKKLKIVALNFSETAKEKLINSGCEVLSISKEIESNPEAKNIQIIK